MKRRSAFRAHHVLAILENVSDGTPLPAGLPAPTCLPRWVFPGAGCPAVPFPRNGGHHCVLLQPAPRSLFRQPLAGRD